MAPAGEPVTGAVGTGSSTLFKRIVSSLVLIPVVVVAAYRGSPWFELLVFVFGLVMAWEWAGIVGSGSKPPRRGTAPGHLFFGSTPPAALVLIGLVGLALVMAGLAKASGDSLALIPVLGLGFVCAMLVAWPSQGRKSIWFGLGFLYITLPCLAILDIRADPMTGLGRETLIWMLALVIATDTGAYAAGRSIGGPKLAPAVSPGKTWAGLIGGILSSGLAGLAAALAFGFPSYWKITIISGILAIVAQLGDLFESWIKRRFGVKDSGHIIPGHGGVLDRVDGLLAVAVAIGVLNYLGGGSILSWL
jgi:phosphatidate cytidylyltransferase